jgi:hypothetical protein
MKRFLDFSNGQRNPYASKLKRPVTIRLDEFTVDYFKAMAEDTSICVNVPEPDVASRCSGGTPSAAVHNDA